MKINLGELPHQQEAIDKILDAFKDCKYNDTEKTEQNPIIKLKLDKGIDVKMETGTGKTYTYTKTIFELNKEYNLNKFIIFVPNLAIKEGTKNFLKADYTRQYFRNIYEKDINLYLINAGDFNTKKGRRKQFPTALYQFVESENINKDIQVMLLNSDMLDSMKKDDFDMTLLNNISCPIDALKDIKPIVIIDEPHKFKRENKAFKDIKNLLEPQLIIRFGATFPINEKTKEIDYENLVYDLDAITSFNQGLVKSIDIHYADDPHNNDTKYKVSNITKNEVEFKKDNKSWVLKINDNLDMDENFTGLTIDKISGGKCILNNDLELYKGSVIDSKIMGQSYQETMLNIALEKHFEKEKINWNRDEKIKTLSLFFIDSIKSWRDKDDGWLKNKFLELLKQKLLKTLEELKNEKQKEQLVDYGEFLQASLNNLDGCCGAYFSRDNKGEQEVEDILKNRDKLLSFKDKNNDWIIRRFLFSKWTLKEGWDNPNVFVIAKLRTSGSETSKIQEVGRGLRLPVNECGNRISDENFILDYIIDSTEKDFADKLIKEINENGKYKLENGIKIQDKVIEELIEVKYESSSLKIKNKLMDEKIIDDNEKIIDSEKLQALLAHKLKENKVRNNPKTNKEMVKLNKDNWNKIKDLWLEITKKYMLKYNSDNINLNEIIQESLKGAFVDYEITLYSQKMNSRECNFYEPETRGNIRDNSGSLKYGEFLKKLSKMTNISVSEWHKEIIKYNIDNNIDNNKINNLSLYNIIENFEKIFKEIFNQKYSYENLDFNAETTLFKNGDFVDEIEKYLLGDEINSEVKENYLYRENYGYDSEIEKDILQNRIDNILVFGKIPKMAIKVPTFTGGTTTPDFIYVIENKINLLAEAKSENERKSDEVAVESLEKVFNKNKKIKNVKFKKVTKRDEVEKILKEYQK
jgi:type III restriction enzyme